MAAGFCCPESQLLAATCWEWDEDEIDWLHRNHARAKRLKKNEFQAVYQYCHDDKEQQEKVCTIKPQEGLFLHKDDSLISFMELIDISQTTTA